MRCHWASSVNQLVRRLLAGCILALKNAKDKLNVYTLVHAML